MVYIVWAYLKLETSFKCNGIRIAVFFTDNSIKIVYILNESSSQMTHEPIFPFLSMSIFVYTPLMFHTKLLSNWLQGLWQFYSLTVYSFKQLKTESLKRINAVFKKHWITQYLFTPATSNVSLCLQLNHQFSKNKSKQSKNQILWERIKILIDHGHSLNCPFYWAIFMKMSSMHRFTQITITERPNIFQWEKKKK